MTEKYVWHPNVHILDIETNRRKALFEEYSLKATFVLPLFNSDS